MKRQKGKVATSTNRHVQYSSYNSNIIKIQHQNPNKMLKTVLFVAISGFVLCMNSRVRGMTDSATGISFVPKKNGLEIFGVGVRKKGPIKVYSVAMYCTESVKNSLQSISRSVAKANAIQSLRDGVKESPGGCTFLLQMAFKVGAEKMASAISDSVAPRYRGSNQNEIDQLRQLLVQGIPADTGASKGTTLQFDCAGDGIAVAINGHQQGKIYSKELSAAFCDVYLDTNCVSPALVDSCLENCCAA
jgi:Chalcone isomerase-like